MEKAAPGENEATYAAKIFHKDLIDENESTIRATVEDRLKAMSLAAALPPTTNEPVPEAPPPHDQPQRQLQLAPPPALQESVHETEELAEGLDGGKEAQATKKPAKRDRSKLPEFDKKGKGEMNKRLKSVSSVNADKPTASEMFRKWPPDRKRVYTANSNGYTAVFHCLKKKV